MSLLDRFFDFNHRGPLTFRDRPLWAAARTLPDLCDLTARWLAGDIASQPGYYGPVDVDDDIAPGLTKALIALNQAGVLTNQSQAGFDGPGSGGWRWRQGAAVVGFADDSTYRWLQDALAGTRFEILAGHCERRGPRVTVTSTDGRPYTRFGIESEADVRFLYDACDPGVVDVLCAAWQVVVYDPMIGSNDLWTDLYEMAVNR